MNKNILIKFFNRETSEKEADSIIEWLDKSQENKEYFAQLKALYTISQESGEMIKGITSTMESSTKIISRAKSTKKLVPIKFLYISMAAALMAIFFSIGLLITGYNSVGNIIEKKSDVTAQNSPNTIRTLYTEKGVKGFIILPDSSKVWLNSHSKLTYPDKFDKKSRNVKIEGEAYFDVKKDSLCPMIITTNKDFAIEVYGTTFNIKSYSNDSQAETTLYSGAITMRYKDKKSAKDEILKLKPNESFIYTNGQSAPKQINYKEPENHSAWKKGKLIFENTPIDEAIKILERWHGTRFIIQNKGIYKHKISAEFTSESIVQIMEIIQIPLSINYTYANNVVTINR